MAEELPTIQCPAGQPARLGTACRCAIERTIVVQPRDHRVVPAVRRYCAGDHTECPTWRTNRDAWLADAHRALGRELAADARGSEGE